MKYRAFKMAFEGGVHLGSGKLSDTGFVLYADTLFSALCHEALEIDGAAGINKLVSYVKEDKLVITDGFPYIGETLYIPKPMHRIITAEDRGNSSLKKQYKKLNYIPCEKLDEYMSGSLDVISELENFKKLGEKQIFAKSAVFENRDSELYTVGAYRFNDDCGLYFIIGAENDDVFDFAGMLFEGLEYSGIGGKRNSGFGRFVLYPAKIDFSDRFNKEYPAYVSLSVSMAREEELEYALDGASYSLIKRSGFVASDTYTDTSEFVKKKDFYSFKSGSMFLRKFSGNVFDVSDNGNHPVYRYAKPVFLGVTI